MTAGGARKGAGRKIGSPNHVAGAGRMPQSWKIKIGDKFITHTETLEGSTMQELTEVISITRTKMILKIGETNLIIVR